MQANGAYTTLPLAVSSPALETDEAAIAYDSVPANGRHTVPGGHHTRLPAHMGDHFRRLEDRLDDLHLQMASTQKMVLELTDLVQKKQRTSVARQNFRTLSGKALKAGHHGPPGTISGASLGPPSSVAIATAFLTSINPNSPTNSHDLLSAPRDKRVLEPPVAATADPAPDKISEGHEASPTHIDTAEDDQLAHGWHQKTPPNRKVSASNPVALRNERTDRQSTIVLAVTHAATFVSELARVASTKKVRALRSQPNSSASAHNGPEMTRRFSISSLGVSDLTKRGSHLSRAVQWSRNLFKHRVEPAVSPEDIQDARSVDSKVHRFTIRHDTVKRTVWDSMMIMLILVDIILTPLALSFKLSLSGLGAYNTVGNVLFFFDFMVNMFSSFTTPRGVLISGPTNTIPHYLTSVWALPDLLSWFPFEVFFSTDRGRFLGVAKVIRLAKISQLARRFQSAKKAGVFRMVRLLGIVFIVSHCLSCYWNWVAKEWRLNEEGYLGKTIGQQYAHCWSLVIGSLNASPPAMYTTIEEVSVAVFMLIGNVLQATVFGSVAVLISSFDEEEVAYNRKLISTYERCRFLDIPEKLSRRIQGYYENLYRETRSVNPDADAFINELSPALICEVKFQLYRDMIKQIPFLSATHINPVVIEMLILHLRTVIYMQDDVLIRKGEFGDWMGFIGSKGSVGVLDPNSDVRKIIRILTKGDYFGEMALLQHAKRSTTAVALSWVQIHVLCRNDLDDVKEQYPEQAEILEQEIHKYMKSKVVYK